MINNKNNNKNNYSNCNRNINNNNNNNNNNKYYNNKVHRFQNLIEIKIQCLLAIMIDNI